MRRILLVLGMLGATLAGQDLTKLPDWAVPAAWATAKLPAPAEADAWVLFKWLGIVCKGDHEVRK